MMNVDVLRAYLQRLLPEALDVLRQMVAVNSFTHHAAGVNRVGELTASCFSTLGFAAIHQQAIECVSAEQPSLGHHLLLRRPGASGPRIAMVGHLDTVFTEQAESENDFVWREIGDRIYGPGTVDIKGGNVMAWMVLRALKELAPDRFEQIDWRVLFNAAEEGLASDFAQVLRKTLGGDALACLVFEGGEFKDGVHRLITHRKGSAGIRVIATGRSAHSGGGHEKGANAIVQLSEVIPQLSRLTDYARDLTCNVGIIRGGTVTNQVPDYAEAMVELRAFDPAVLDEALQKAMRLNGLSTIASFSDGYPAKIRIEHRLSHTPWPENGGSALLLDHWRSAGEEMGVRVGGQGRGGLSDGNFAYDLAPTVDGLGPVGGNLHCSTRIHGDTIHQEYVQRDSFVTRAMLNVLGICRLVDASLAPR